MSALFYAAEAAVVALAEVHAIDTKRSHRLKADAAAELHARGLISENFGPLLRALNQARKAVWYEGEKPDFGGQDLASIADDVERLVATAEAANAD